MKFIMFLVPGSVLVQISAAGDQNMLTSCLQLVNSIYTELVITPDPFSASQITGKSKGKVVWVRD